MTAGRPKKQRPDRVTAGDREAHLRALGQRVGEARSQRGWSPEDLAARAGVTGPTIRSIERGQSDVTTWTLRKLATALGMPAGYLGFGG